MKQRTRYGLWPLIAGFSVLLSGCTLEVLNPGAILDEDLNTPDLMPIVVAGSSAELNDVMDGYAFTGGLLTEDLSGTGSYFSTGQYRLGRFDNQNSEGFWEQTHEAAWAAGEAWARLQTVLESAASTNADAARLFYLMGTAHQRLGENFCDLVYDKGPVQPRTAAFDSAIIAFNQSKAIGGAANAAKYVSAGWGGLAQAYVGLGDWGSAVAAAGNVATDYVIEAIYHQAANSNQVYNETWGRAEVGVWATPIARQYNKASDVVNYKSTGDPRVPYTVCGSWNDTNRPPDVTLGVTPTGTCTGQGSGATQGAGGLTAHHRQDKYTERGSDVPTITGTEMRLIEAENAVRSGDQATFITKINLVRNHYGSGDLSAADLVAVANGAGALNWDNCSTWAADCDVNEINDMWSILDRERYMTLWLEGRRFWDLYRWDHPFLNGGTLIGPGEPRRASCMPIPEIECTLNENIANHSVCTSG